METKKGTRRRFSSSQYLFQEILTGILKSGNARSSNGTLIRSSKFALQFRLLLSLKMLRGYDRNKKKNKKAISFFSRALSRNDDCHSEERQCVVFKRRWPIDEIRLAKGQTKQLAPGELRKTSSTPCMEEISFFSPGGIFSFVAVSQSLSCLFRRKCGQPYCH